MFTIFSAECYLGTPPISNWNLEMLAFEERGSKTRVPGEKTSRSKDENQQRIQPTSDGETRNRTQATLLGGECSHHRAIPAPQYIASETVCLSLRYESGRFDRLPAPLRQAMRLTG